MEFTQVYKIRFRKARNLMSIQLKFIFLIFMACLSFPNLSRADSSTSNSNKLVEQVQEIIIVPSISAENYASTLRDDLNFLNLANKGGEFIGNEIKTLSRDSNKINI